MTLTSGRIPYWLALKVSMTAARFIFRPFDALVWARNSYLTDSFVPMKSDLDLTLYLREVPPLAKRNTFRKFRQVLKLCFPALGELSVYLGQDLELIAANINAFELERDPQLKKLLTSTGSDTRATKNHAAQEQSAFIIRMLHANSKMFRGDSASLQRPLPRQRKWRNYLGLNDGQEAAPPITPQLLVLSAVQALSDNASEREAMANELADALFKQQAKDASARKGDNSKPTDHYKSALVWSAFPNLLCFLLPDQSYVFSTPLIDLMRAQLEWEIWGLSSQLLFWDDRQNLRKHLENLRIFAAHMNRIHRANFEPVIASIQTLERHAEAFFTPSSN